MQMRSSKTLRQPLSTRHLAYGALLAAVYVVIGQFVRIPNPMVGGGAIIAINMVVIVLAGILLGPTLGAIVGFVATGLNGVFLGGAAASFEFASVIPHTIMGWTAGLVGRWNPIAGAFTILVGHALNLLSYYLVGLMGAGEVGVAVFSVGLLAEATIDVIVIVIATPLLRPLVKPKAG